MVVTILAHTPLYVWALALFLLWIGYKSCFARTVSLGRVFSIPLLFLILGYNNIQSIFGVSFLHISIYLGGLVGGAVLGYFLTREQTMVVNRADKTLQLPGDKVTLIVIFSNFLFQYAMHVTSHFDLGYLLSHAEPVLGVMGFLTGVSVGRAGTYLSRFFVARV